jgi:hypothetical protein
MTNEFIFANLPIDIINYILYFTGKLYYHNGKYIGKLDFNNKNYEKIKNIPKPIRLSLNKYNLYLINKNNLVGYILHYTINSDKMIIALQLIIYKKDYSETLEWYLMPNIYSKWRRVISLSNLI